MEKWGVLLAVPLLMFITSLFMKLVDRMLANHDRKRKEKKEEEEKGNTSAVEIQRSKDAKELDLLRLEKEDKRRLEESRDATNRRIEQILSDENERLHKEISDLHREIFHLRTALTSAMFGFKLVEQGGSAQELKELGGRIAVQVAEADKQKEEEK
jgi:hypothetical protein